MTMPLKEGKAESLCENVRQIRRRIAPHHLPRALMEKRIESIPQEGEVDALVLHHVPQGVAGSIDRRKTGSIIVHMMDPREDVAPDLIQVLDVAPVTG